MLHTMITVTLSPLVHETVNILLVNPETECANHIDVFSVSSYDSRLVWQPSEGNDVEKRLLRGSEHLLSTLGISSLK